jgi:NitT/TauT family transport system substrate-binding protein
MLDKIGMRAFGAVILLLTGLSGALAQDKPKIQVVHTLFMDVAPLFSGVQRGYFKDGGLEVEAKSISLNPLIPAALQSDSAQLGVITPPTFLQAIDGGIDLVAIAGGSINGTDSKSYAVVAKSGLEIKNPKELEGKKVGVPGIGAALDLLSRDWMLKNGVDLNKVTFVEVAFPQGADTLKGGSVDALVTGEPMLGRITGQNLGTVIAYFTQVQPPELPTTIVVGTRKWVTANAAAVKQFQQGYTKGVELVQKDVADAKVDVKKHLPFPPAVVDNAVFPSFNANATVEGLNGWIAILKRQNGLKSDIEAAKVIVR